MRAALDVQLSIFNRQKNFISSALGRPSASFQRYQARYAQRTQSYLKSASNKEIAARVSMADVVYVGDYHTLRYAQQSFLKLAQDAVRRSRPVVLALEFVEGQHQNVLDAYLRGRLGEKSFLRRIGHPYRSGFDIWPHFKPIFDFARAHSVQVIGIDLRATGPRSLNKRDQYAASLIHSIFHREDKPQVFVLMGQYHIAPQHLPHEVNRLCSRTERPRFQILYQNCDDIYWKLAARGECARIEAVTLSDHELCLIHTSPIAAQQSFIDYLEAEAKLETIETAAYHRLEEYAHHLGKWLEIDTTHALSDVRLEVAEKSVSHSKESFFSPSKRLVFLSSYSLNHIADVATQCVRAVCIPEESRLEPKDEFFANILRNALSFWGSKFFNPHRKTYSLTEMSHGPFDTKNIVQKILEMESAKEVTDSGILKQKPNKKKHLQEHAAQILGRLLGDAMFRQFARSRLKKNELKRMFLTSFGNASETYFQWKSRFPHSK